MSLAIDHLNRRLTLAPKAFDRSVQMKRASELDALT